MSPGSLAGGPAASGINPGRSRTRGSGTVRTSTVADVVDTSWAPVDSPDELADSLERVGYLADEGVATAAFLALRLGRPLFCEGEPGTGKTSLALALAEALGVKLIKLQCHEGIDFTQALYDWDFPRQLLHLRALEAAAPGELDSDMAEKSLYSRRFLLARPLLRALEESPCVLLVDEVDRADDEFEAYLLEVLGENAVTVPELGEVRAEVPPLVILTSNRTREVHDALKRRCLYHWLEHPALAREVAILRRRLPGLSPQLANQVASAVRRLREVELLKPPGVAESIDWAEALRALGKSELDAAAAAATLGAVLKYREDAQRVVAAGLDQILAG
ncbi:MAG: AAA domain-containing protein [Actinophytocola sp.]|nr:AAA domain-containing protein [Actinophytocola sp.]